MSRPGKSPPFQQPFLYDGDFSTNQNIVDAFHKRQQEDLERHNQGAATPFRRRPFHERYSDVDNRDESSASQLAKFDDMGSSEEGWRDSEGDRLNDFGVDEDAEIYDEDDVPLAELLHRRNESLKSNGQ